MRGRVSARGKAGGKRRTSLRRRIFSILSFVMPFLLFFAAACPNGTLTLAEDSGTYDFTDDITSVTFTYTDYDGVTHEYTDGDVIYEDYTITFTIEYTLSAYMLSEEVNTITCTLPDALKYFTGSGYVYSSSGVKLGEYVISDGVISITFYDDTVEKNAGGSPVTGYVTFSGEAEEIESDEDGDSDVDIGFNDDISFTLTVSPTEESKGDISVEKEVSAVDESAGTITYTITVSSAYGTSGSVVLTDIMDGASISEDDVNATLTVTLSDGTKTTTSVSVSVSQTDDGCVLTLDAMPENSVYVITYTAVLDDDVAGTNTSVSNTVTATSENSDGDEISDSDDAETEIYGMIEKSGSYDSSTGTITWTVVINAAGADISGWTLSDELNGETFSGTVTISPAVSSDADSEEITLPYTFPVGSTSTYTITYTTDADAVAGKNYATNTAEISPSDEKISYSDDVTIYNVGYNYGIEKEGTGTTLDSENEVLILSWSATVTADGEDLENWTYYDYLSGSYFTDAQKSAILSMLDSVLGSGTYTVEWYGSSGSWTGFKVNVTGFTLADGESVTFSYSSNAEIPDEKTTYTNSANVNNTQYDSGTNTYALTEFTLTKTDANDSSGGSETSHEYDDTSGTLSWNIVFYVPEDVTNDIVITESLPDGVSISSLSISGSGTTYSSFSGTFDVSSSSSTIYIYNWWSQSNVGSWPLTAETSEGDDGSEVVITISASTAAAIGGFTVTLTVTVKIDDAIDYDSESTDSESTDTVWTYTTDDDGTVSASASFTNSVTLESGDTSLTDEQTQDITDEYTGDDDLKSVTDSDGNTVEIDDLSSAVIEVIYAAHLTENAVIVSGSPSQESNDNAVYLEFSNNPNSESTGITTEDIVYVFTYKLSISKVDEDENALTGAKFKLYDSDENEVELICDDDLGAYRPVADGESGEELEADSDGKYRIVGLDAGTYEL